MGEDVRQLSNFRDVIYGLPLSSLFYLQSFAAVTSGLWNAKKTLTLAFFSLMLTGIFASTCHNVDPHRSKLPRRHRPPPGWHKAKGEGVGEHRKELTEPC